MCDMTSHRSCIVLAAAFVDFFSSFCFSFILIEHLTKQLTLHHNYRLEVKQPASESKYAGVKLGFCNQLVWY